ncbi:MAG: hypothetical protein MI975_20290 [Cytophagales bacterium]|nr:hypothetical protein [Cytophagales bacterium]
MEKITISKRHKRLLSSLLFVLEQKTESIEHMLRHAADNASYCIAQDLEDPKKKELIDSCARLKQVMREVSEQLDLPKRVIGQSQYISTIQSQMWENITDAFSGNLTGYGEGVMSSAGYADPFIQKLSDQIDKLKIEV